MKDRVVRAVFAAAVVAGCGSVWADIPASAYVQRGLILHYDGIENAGAGQHNATATSWSNLATGSGSGDMSLPAGAVIQQNSIDFGKAKGEVSSVSCARSTEEITAQVSVRTAESITGNDQVFFDLNGRLLIGYDGRSSDPTSDNKGLCVVLPRNKDLTAGNTADYRWFGTFAWNDYAPDRHTISVTGPVGAPTTSSVYFDTTKFAANSAAWNTSVSAPNGKLFIGNTTVPYVFNAVRIYNRALSADEIAYNAWLDDVRFSGGAIPEKIIVMPNGGLAAKMTATFNAVRASVSADGHALQSGLETLVPFDAGQPTVTLTVTPAKGYVIRGVIGASATVDAEHNTVAVNMLSGCVFEVTFVKEGLENVLHVTPDGTGDGSDWDHPIDLSGALAAAKEGSELWLKAGTYAPQAQLTTDKALTIRGGFAGTEEGADERTGTACSVIDGEMAYPTGTASGVVKGLFKVTAASGTLTLDRIEITRSYQQGLQVSGGANVVLKGCRFIDNGYYVNANNYAMPGRGAYLTGAATATVQVEGCCFEGNIIGLRTGSDMGNGASSGGGLYVKTFASVDLADCAFVTNGLPTKANAKSGRDYCRGGALYAEDAPVTATRVKFIGNGAISHGTLAGGSAVFLVNNCGGSSFTNCLFLANFCRSWGATGSYGGAFCAELGANDQTLAFGNCTFAYNLDSPTAGSASLGAGAVMITKGALDCRDSIFYGNLVRSGCTLGADLYCGANASAVLDNCFLTDPKSSDYIRNNGGSVTVTNARQEDPLLATDKPAMLTMLNATGSLVWPINGADFRFKDGSDLTLFDAHLRSRAGRWNGTACMLRDKVNSPAIDAAGTDVDWSLEPEPNGSRANAGAYGGTVEASKTAGAGDGMVYYVTPDGTGDGSGWDHPAGLADAIAGAAEGDELRLMTGTYALPASLQSAGFTVDKPIVIAGGYTGAGDDSIATDAETVIDGAVNGARTYPTTSPNGLVNVTAGTGTVTLRRLVVARSKFRGLNKSGAANLVLDRCRIEDNGGSTAFLGRGAYFTGTAGVTLVSATNCVFAGNGAGLGTTDIGNVDISGCGAYCLNLKRFELFNTTFVTNGLALNNGSGRDKTHGGAIYASNAPVVADNCDFIGNGVILHNGSAADGGIVYFTGNCGGTAFTSCRFLGNFARNWGGGSVGEGGGVIAFAGSGDYLLDRVTVAFNTAATKNNCACGLTVSSGGVTVRDSIFYANACANNTATSSTARDIVVKGGSLRLENTIVSEDSALSCRSVGGSADFSGARFEEPAMVSTASDMLTAINKTSFTAAGIDVKFRAASYLMSFDAHLRSTGGRYANGEWVTDEVLSPGVDEARRSAAFARELEPNGSRANLGGYSNTDEASKPPAGTPSIDGEVVVNQSADYSNPHFDFTLGEGFALADVTVYTGLSNGGDGEWEHVKLYDANCRPGQEVSADAGFYYAKGDVIYWKVVVSDHGGDAKVVRTGSFTMESSLPPFWTAGGDPATVIHCWPSAPGNNDGTSWRHAYTSFAAALAAFAADETKTELWLGGTDAFAVTEPFAITRAVAVRGGFTCGESAPEERPFTQYATLDGGFASDLVTSALAAGTLTFDGIAFRAAASHALVKTGLGDLALLNCRFADCGSVGPTIGAGVNMTGAANLVVSNCTFDSCLSSQGAEDNKNDFAYGLYLEGLASAVVEDTTFVDCGYPVNSTCSRSYAKGSVVQANGTPVAFRRCDFRGCGSQVNMHGAVVFVTGSSSGSSFVNCAFSGCHGESYSTGVAGALGGVLGVELASADGTVLVDNCTFAYNVGPLKASATALTVVKGTVDVRNSIFHGNVAWTASGGAADLWAGASGTLTATRCLFDGEGAAYCAASAGGTLTLVDCDLGDPLLATPRETFAALLDTCTSGLTFSFKNPNTGYNAFDLHLRSSEGRWTDGEWVRDEGELSPAIDAGRAGDDYSHEPTPNGNRLNLGAYGNTAEASKTSEAHPEIDGFTLDTTSDYTQPHFRFTLGGDGAYTARLYILLGSKDWGETTEGWEKVVELPPASMGESLDLYPREYLQPGDGVYWRVLVVAPYGTVSEHGDYIVEGSLPPWYGKGGGAGVIHVRTGATGKGTGLNWTDAYADFETARQAISDERREIWLAGAFEHTGDCPVTAVDAPLAIRGGFTGAENAAGERPQDGSRAVFTNADSDYVLRFAGTSALVLDRVEFTSRNCVRGVTVTGGVRLTVDGCRFHDCLTRYVMTTVETSSLYSGLLNALSVNGGSVLVTNTVFDANRLRQSTGPTGAEYGALGNALKLVSVAEVTVADTLFATNGVFMAGNTPGREQANGSAVYVSDSPAMFVRCGFVGNGTLAHNNGNSGSIVYVAGGSAGTSFENCRFVGNTLQRWQGEAKCGSAGTVNVNLANAADAVSVDNCTFAYNVGDASLPAATGLLVTKGAVSVRNSVFHGNLAYTNGLMVADIRVKAGASCAVDWTLFDSTNDLHVAGDGTLTFGEHILLGDPLFRSKLSDFVDLLSTKTGVSLDPEYPVVPLWTRLGTGKDPSVLDVHVRRRSPAIDAGDPAAEWRNELEPNGRRVNLGAYGNTPEARRSPYGLLLMVK